MLVQEGREVLARGLDITASAFYVFKVFWFPGFIPLALAFALKLTKEIRQWKGKDALGPSFYICALSSGERECQQDEPVCSLLGVGRFFRRGP